MYRLTANKQIVAAVYEECMDWEHDSPTSEYEAWAVTACGIERIYIAKSTLEKSCISITEEEVERVSPALIETLRIVRPDDIRAAKVSPRFTCEHGEGCTLPEHSQGWLWRDAQTSQYRNRGNCLV